MSSSQINLSWQPSLGATQYVVERSADGGPWTVIATGILAPLYFDSGLAPATTYAYDVVATSNGGDSPASLPATAQTSALADALSSQPLTIAATRRLPFTGTITTFTDVNTQTAAGSFVAIVHWGDGSVSRGTVTGSDGVFSVIGRHTYSAAGHFVIRVTVTMSAPATASTSSTSKATISARSRTLNRKVARIHPSAVKTRRIPAVVSHPSRTALPQRPPRPSRGRPTS